MNLRGYVICTTQRSGSTLLCQLLASTGALGRPDEYFRTPDMRGAGFESYPTDPDQQLVEVLKRGAGPNGVYGLKIVPWQVRLAAQARWAERLPGLRFVRLDRRDVLLQAISLARATQTDRWTSPEGEIRPPAYDAAAIDQALADVTLGMARWDRWFAAAGVEPMRVAYEDITADNQRVVDAIAATVGVPGKTCIDYDLVDLERQRDETSAEWRTRFVAERRAF